MGTQSEANDYTYEFSKLFKALTAQHLIIVVQNIGNDKLREYIFKNNPQQILNSYSMIDCFKLLDSYYFDTFAIFIFYKFRSELYKPTPLHFRDGFLSLLSMHVLTMIFSPNDILCCTKSESLTIFFKLVQYVQSEPNYRLRSRLKTYGYIRRIQHDITSQTIPDSIFNLCSQYLDPQAVYNAICKQMLRGNNAYIEDEKVKDEHVYFL